MIRKLDKFEHLVNKIKEGVPTASQDLTRDSSLEELHHDRPHAKPKVVPVAGKKDSILAKLVQKKQAIQLPAL